jgi:hypothetical protein
MLRRAFDGRQFEIPFASSLEWNCLITAPDGIHYHPREFDKLLSFSPALQPRAQLSNDF